MGERNIDLVEQVRQLEQGKPVTYKGITLKRSDFPPKSRKLRSRLGLSPTLVQRLQEAVLRGHFPTERYVEYRSRARTARGIVEVEGNLRRWFRDGKLAKQAHSLARSSDAKGSPSTGKKSSKKARSGRSTGKAKELPKGPEEYLYETNYEDKLRTMKDFCRRRGIFPKTWTASHRTYGLLVTVPPDKAVTLCQAGWKRRPGKPKKKGSKRDKKNSADEPLPTFNHGRRSPFLQGGLTGLGRKH